MDDLTAALSGFGVSHTLNDPSAPHPRYAQYKQRRGPDQNERRRRILENQKQRRFDAQAHIRALSEDSWEGLPYGQKADQNQDDAMDTDQVKPRHPGRYYRDQLMLSEWMIEVPENMTDEWLMVACPVGKRCLVIAGSGYSSAYGKNGFYVIESFQSHLPGGCGRYRQNWDSTILDCIYHDVTRTFYILDMMCWNGMEVYNSDIEFRIFWLQTKLSEWEGDLTEFKKSNQFRFVPLTFQPCDNGTITTVLDQWAPHELDGLLFYHKRVHYLFGANPLCLWLQAYMLPDILHIPVPDGHMKRAPQNYVSFDNHLAKVKEKKAKEEEKEKKRQERKEQRRREEVPEEYIHMNDEDNIEVDPAVLEQVPQSVQPKKNKKKKKKKGSGEGDEMQTETLPTEEEDREEEIDEGIDES